MNGRLKYSIGGAVLASVGLVATSVSAQEIVVPTDALPDLPGDITYEIVGVDIRGLPEDEQFKGFIKELVNVAPGEIARSNIQEKVDEIYGTGYFAKVEAQFQETGVNRYRLIYELELNPVVNRVTVNGANRAGEAVINEIFGDFPTGVLRNYELEKRIIVLESWYQQQGYTLAKVKESRVADNQLFIQVDEGKITDIDITFINDRGKAIQGRTQLPIILRELRVRPGDLYQEQIARLDKQALEQLGIFNFVDQQVRPTDDGYILRYVISERRNRQFNLGFNTAGRTGIGLTLNYDDKNLAGLRQELNIEVNYASNQDVVGSIRYFNPFVAERMGLQAEAGYGYTRPLSLDGGRLFVPTAVGGQAQIRQVPFQVGLPMILGGWTLFPFLSLRAITMESTTGEAVSRDILGNRLTASGRASEVLLLGGVNLTRDTRDSSFVATRGSLFKINWKQSLGVDGIFYGQASADVGWYMPIPRIKIAQRTAALALGGSIGLSYGNLPPYEAYILGGEQTVRGWAVGDIASSRNYLLASVELRIPLPANLYGVVFFDAGTDMGSQGSTPGKPGIVRDKPGSGFGYGIGIRVLDQQLGLDWGFNNQGQSQVTVSGKLRF